MSGEGSFDSSGRFARSDDIVPGTDNGYRAGCFVAPARATPSPLSTTPGTSGDGQTGKRASRHEADV
jgi:hypothetical protein